MKYFLAIFFVSLLVLAAMSAKIFRAPMEEDLTAKARAELDRLGFTMIDVEFDYLDAKLSGNVANQRMKEEAGKIVGSISGARVQHNNVTFGLDLAPVLKFESGSPVVVTGALSVTPSSIGLDEGFDCSGVEKIKSAPAVWEPGVSELAKLFFDQIGNGSMQLEGRWVTLRGEASNHAIKWRLLDLADSLGSNLDVIDEMTVAKTTPFELVGSFGSSGLVVEGETSDPALVDDFQKSFPGCETDKLELVGSASSPPWARSFLLALEPVIDLASNGKFSIIGDKITVAADFPSQFWADTAKARFEADLPDGLEPELSLSVVKKAIADQGEDDAERLDVRVQIAQKVMKIDGRVRLRAERDKIVKLLGKARPDLKVQSNLRYSYREPEFATVRKALPDVLAYLVGGIGAYGEIDLTGDRWIVRGVCPEEKFLGEVNYIGSGLRDSLGLPIDVELRRSVPLAASEESPFLEDYPIYFKGGSAQLGTLQQEKLAALAEALKKIPDTQEITLVGNDTGDAHIVSQRTRALRRALAELEVPFERLKVRSETSDSPVTWQSQRVMVELQPSEAGEELNISDKDQ